jgi:uncharacterized protein (TIGR02996 family)
VSVVRELVEAVEADPEDLGPQLVLADCLQAAGDPRGELIILDHGDRATPGGLTDPAALDRLLLLAAIYGFPCARSTDESMLPFVRLARAAPVDGEDEYAYDDELATSYHLEHGGHRYHLRYGWTALCLSIDDGAIDSGVDYPGGFPHEPDLDGPWTANQERLILTIVSDAIREGTPFAELRFPFGFRALPVHEGAPLRCYALPEAFTAPRGLGRYQRGLAARDYHRWHALWDRLRRGAPDR